MDMFLPSCKEAVRLQSQALDGALGLKDRLRLRFHLLMCTLCRRYVQQIAFLHDKALRDERLNEGAVSKLSPEANSRMVEIIKENHKH